MSAGEEGPPLEAGLHLGVVVRQDTPELDGVLATLVKEAADRGVHLSFEEHALPSVGADAPVLDLAARPPDMVVALGGDGTLLRASRLLFGSGIPLLGINLGNLGFLTSAGAREVAATLDRLIAGRYTLERRFTLRASVFAGDGTETERFYALNDMVEHKAGAARVARLEIRVGEAGQEEEVGSFSGDGVIVATPTGSTAYNLSAGGPIVVPTMECLTITPICPFTLAVRPLVVSSGDAVVILALELDPSLVLTVDGQDGRHLIEGEWVRIERGGTPHHLVQFPGRTFFSTLRKKRNWAARPSADDGATQ